MNDTSDTLPKPRRRSRKAAEAAATPEPAVRAILDEAVQTAAAHAEPVAGAGDDAETTGTPGGPVPPGRPRRRRRATSKSDAPPPAASGRGGRGSAPRVAMPAASTAVDSPVALTDTAPAAPVAPAVTHAVTVDDAPSAIDRPDAVEPAHDAVAVTSVPEDVAEAGPADRDDAAQADTAGEDTSRHDEVRNDSAEEGSHADRASAADSPPPEDGDHSAPLATPPAPHHWVYLAAAVFLLALGFGLWGVWTTFFAADPDARSTAALLAGNEKLSQEITILRRSDQISREANRDLERTLAERDEEIAGLRADVAFYERFVGATGQRRGLSVHDLEMRLQSGEVWHFVATLTQNVNRGAVNNGRVTLSVEGTRNDRLERLSWSALRKQNNAPGQPYSFKYFQQVEGELMLPQGFKPLRVTVRLVPQGGSAVEQSFPWPDTVRGGTGG